MDTTNPDTSSLADKDDFTCVTLTVLSASRISQPKLLAQSAVSGEFFTGWCSSAAIFSNCKLLKKTNGDFEGSSEKFLKFDIKVRD